MVDALLAVVIGGLVFFAGALILGAFYMSFWLGTFFLATAFLGAYFSRWDRERQRRKTLKQIKELLGYDDQSNKQ